MSEKPLPQQVFDAASKISCNILSLGAWCRGHRFGRTKQDMRQYITTIEDQVRKLEGLAKEMEAKEKP